MCKYFPLTYLDLDVCKICLEKQKGVFHPSNINHIKILDLAFESAIKMEQWKESLKYGILLIEGYRYTLTIVVNNLISKFFKFRVFLLCLFFTLCP